MNIIILTEEDRINENSFLVNGHRAEHIRAILKLQVGDSLEIGILNGPKGSGRIEKIDNQGVIIHADTFPELDQDEVAPQIVIICALPRPQTLKKVLLTCGMMNVHSLYLIRANRVEKSYYHSPLLNPHNYKPFLVEGLSQGKFTRLPEVKIFERFKPFFEDIFPEIEKEAGPEHIKLLPDSESEMMLNDVCSGHDRHIMLAIGPEGGWVPFEIDMMIGLGFKIFSLGPWVLRVEHAFTAALAQIEAISSIKNTHK
jgi:RsmE family RNA methyltransferase